jgi:hypothetical protein
VRARVLSGRALRSIELFVGDRYLSRKKPGKASGRPELFFSVSKIFKMNRTVSVLIVLSLVICAFLSGCANVHLVPFKDNTYINDFTDSEDRKGYVEFYVGGSSDFMIARVFKLIKKSSGGNKRLLGLIGQYNRQTKIFIIEKPGTYTYLVKKETSMSTVNVRVVEGMLTRARVNIEEICQEKVRNRRGEKVLVDFFDIHVTPEPPVPFTKKIDK